MGIVPAIVLYLVIWSMTYFVAIPIRIQTQGEAGKVVPGTHDSSPQVHHLKKKAWLTTIAATVIWAIVAGIVISGTITVRDIDWFDRMGPSAPE